MAELCIWYATALDLVSLVVIWCSASDNDASRADIMISAYFLEFLALALALAGLVAVVWEIVSKDVGLLRAITTDVRAMAEPGKTIPTQRFIPETVDLGSHANSNELKKAA
jgi:hypothetical protein